MLRTCGYVGWLNLCLLHGSKLPLAPHTIAAQTVCINRPCCIIFVPLRMLNNPVLVTWWDESCNDEVFELNIP